MLGAIELEDLVLGHIEDLARQLKSTRPLTKSYSTIRKELFENDEFLSSTYRSEILTLASAIAKFGFERDLIVSHPFKEFKLPNSGDKP